MYAKNVRLSLDLLRLPSTPLVNVNCEWCKFIRIILLYLYLKTFQVNYMGIIL